MAKKKQLDIPYPKEFHRHGFILQGKDYGKQGSGRFYCQPTWSIKNESLYLLITISHMQYGRYKKIGTMILPEDYLKAIFKVPPPTGDKTDKENEGKSRERPSGLN